MQTLQTLGISDDKIISHLSYLKSQKNYTSYGEVDKVLELIERERIAEEAKYQQQINKLLNPDPGMDVEMAETIKPVVEQKAQKRV